jgi:Ca2+-transporting ATPase
MTRPPKAIDEPFFSARKIFLSCMQGVGILVISMLVYLTALKTGHSEETIRTLTFVTLIASNIAVILSNRSWTNSIFMILITPNKSVKWVVGGAAFFLVLILNIPFLLDLFQFEKVGIGEAALAGLAGLFSITWFEFYKRAKLNKKAFV